MPTLLAAEYLLEKMQNSVGIFKQDDQKSVAGKCQSRSPYRLQSNRYQKQWQAEIAISIDNDIEKEEWK
ncbi:unnamed protein product [Gongylonema pulchrum]|uniref:Uncharacterized protein n=1 Tax=Gongylonema pulchrum TaxID=637853 RepID=A0A183DRI0_9BILA|nr:unnamed protein product [Gongylonema pulchrum]